MLQGLISKAFRYSTTASSGRSLCGQGIAMVVVGHPAIGIGGEGRAAQNVSMLAYIRLCRKVKPARIANSPRHST